MVSAAVALAYHLVSWLEGLSTVAQRQVVTMLDVCAGHAGNLPGQVNFTPVAPVLPVGLPVLFLLHLGMIPFCGYLEWRAALTGAPLPAWMFQERKNSDKEA